MRKAGLALALMVALLVPSMSFAQGGPGEANFDVPNLQGVTVWGILGFGYGFGTTGLGVGGRYSYPLTHESVIKNQSFQDRFVLEPGIDIVHASYDLGPFGSVGVTLIEPVVGVAWDFWFNKNLAVYPKLDLGYGIGAYSGTINNAGFGGLDFGGSIGAIYKLDGLALRAELGNLGLKAGVMFSL